MTDGGAAARVGEVGGPGGTPAGDQPPPLGFPQASGFSQTPGFSQTLREDRVLAILRYRDADPGAVIAAIGAITAGGVRVVEVTTSTPGWQEAIAAASSTGALVGAGTVLTVEQVRDTAAAGGRFVVSPGLDPEVVRVTMDLGLEPLPGVLTATEVSQATRMGVRWLKLFPAGALGPDYLAQLRGPFADLRFVPTGGITLGDIPAWLAVGASALALGSELAGRTAPTDPDGLRDLRARAVAAVTVTRPARRAGTGAPRSG